MNALAWLQRSTLATTIANSLYLLAGLSAVHLVGFTLLMGSAVVANLRLAGVLLPALPLADVTGPTRRAMLVGLGISVTTGLLLFSTRATGAIHNGFFELKMILLVLAATFTYAVQPRFGLSEASSAGARRTAGIVGLLLWMSVALAGCAFILIE